jgi:hypothetical protein
VGIAQLGEEKWPTHGRRSYAAPVASPR